jgi:hypothetical protein
MIHSQDFARGHQVKIYRHGSGFMAELTEHEHTVFMAHRDTLAEAAVWAGVEVGIRLSRITMKENA